MFRAIQRIINKEREREVSVGNPISMDQLVENYAFPIWLNPVFGELDSSKPADCETFLREIASVRTQDSRLYVQIFEGEGTFLCLDNTYQRRTQQYKVLRLSSVGDLRQSSSVWPPLDQNELDTAIGYLRQFGVIWDDSDSEAITAVDAHRSARQHYDGALTYARYFPYRTFTQDNKELSVYPGEGSQGLIRISPLLEDTQTFEEIAQTIVNLGDIVRMFGPGTIAISRNDLGQYATLTLSVHGSDDPIRLIRDHYDDGNPVTVQDLMAGLQYFQVSGVLTQGDIAMITDAFRGNDGRGKDSLESEGPDSELSRLAPILDVDFSQIRGGVTRYVPDGMNCIGSQIVLRLRDSEETEHFFLPLDELADGFNQLMLARMYDEYVSDPNTVSFFKNSYGDQPIGKALALTDSFVLPYLCRDNTGRLGFHLAFARSQLDLLRGEDKIDGQRVEMAEDGLRTHVYTFVCSLLGTCYHDLRDVITSK